MPAAEYVSLKIVGAIIRFPDLLPALSRYLMLMGGSPSIPPLLYPRLLFLRCLTLRLREETRWKVPRGSFVQHANSFPPSLLQDPVRSHHAFFVVCRSFSSCCTSPMNGCIPVSAGRTLL